MNIKRIEFGIITFLILLGLFFRLELVKDNHFHFYFDQARDANVSRSIIEDRDFKVQGPSASGTDDTVYHGVLYYYLIGPIYTFSGGNPAAVVFFLGLLNSLTILPIYFVAKDISKSKLIAFFSSFLYAFSIDAAQVGLTLFNASLTTFLIPWFFLFLWKVFIQKQDKLLPIFALVLGLTHQSAIFTFYLFAIVGFFYFNREIRENRIFLFNKKVIFRSFATYLLTISSIIFTQLRLYRIGIFKPNDTFFKVQHDIDLATTLSLIFRLFSEKISFSLFPTIATFSFILFFLIFNWFLFRKTDKDSKLILVVWFLAPLWLYAFAFKDSYHTLIGILPAIYIVVSFWLARLAKTKSGTILVFLALVLFVASNWSQMVKFRKQEFDRMSVQREAYLNSQLDLIDYTYSKSDGKPFSISTLTAPHGYNTTWAYLYDWYGKKYYDYIPSWFGPSQKGIPAGELLEPVEKPLAKHFVIFEPDPGSLDVHRFEFEDLQNIYAGSPSATLNFGRLILEDRSN